MRTAFEALQTQTRQNMAMFERALGMFSPFQAGQAGQAAQPGGAPANGTAHPSPAGAQKRQDDPAGQPGTNASELAELRAQMLSMQAKLEKMAGGKG